MTWEKCEKCGRTFKNAQAIGVHRYYCIGPDAAPRDMVLCRLCNEMVPLEDMAKDRRVISGRSRVCRSCDRKRCGNYYANNPQKMRQKSREQRNRFPEKKRAKALVQSAIRSGRLEKPNHCSSCGRSDLRIDAHHYDYSKPLDVTWLCTECHGELHARTTR